MLQEIKARVPAWLKVLVTQFGACAVAVATALLVACAAMLLLTAVLLPLWAGWFISGTILVFEVWIGWRLRSFRLIGESLCACGRVRENRSQRCAAKNRFKAALRFMADRQKAYEGLFRIADSEGEFRELAKIISSNEQPLSAQFALLAGRSLLKAGDLAGAVPYFELADKLSSSDTARLELAGLHMELGAAEKCLQVLHGLARPDGCGHSFFLRAAALRMLGKHSEALAWANRATQRRPCNPTYQLEKGKILECLGRHKAARKQYDKSIRLHPRNPDALFQRALLSSLEGDWESVVSDSEQCYYYENLHVGAYLLAHRARSRPGNNRLPDNSVQKEYPSWLRAEPLTTELLKGETASVKVFVCPETAADECRLAALEPFGSGLEVQPREINIGRLAGSQMHEVEFRVKAKRPNEVNLGKAWTLNFALTSNCGWASCSVRYNIRDTESGRAFLILTNDHEPRPRAGDRLDGSKFGIRPAAFERQLVQNLVVADRLAENHGFRWTHLLDAAGAIALPQWASTRDDLWGEVWNRAKGEYRAAVLRGHDIQAHLHLNAMPESAFFCYGHDPAEKIIFFDQGRRDQLAHREKIKSWANVTPHYGKPSNVNSRAGSLARAKQLVGSILETPSEGYHPVLFRAGQWDLGANLVEQEKSIFAIKENRFLADSSVTNRDHYGAEGPDFGKPPQKCCYFTQSNNPTIPAKRLRDAGILEVVPIIQSQGRQPISPRSNPKSVVQAFQRLVRKGQMKPGRHLFMEIEHLSTIEVLQQAGIEGKETQTGEWKQMDKHLAALRRECSSLEGVGAREAIAAWLDYYSPEIVVRVETPGTETGAGDSGRSNLRFRLRFLGQGILTADKRSYKLLVPIPTSTATRSRIFRVLENSRVVWEGLDVGTEVLSLNLSLSYSNQNDFTFEAATASNCSHLLKVKAAASPLHDLTHS